MDSGSFGLTSSLQIALQLDKLLRVIKTALNYITCQVGGRWRCSKAIYSENLEKTTQGEDIFRIVHSDLKGSAADMDSVGIHADGAAEMKWVPVPVPKAGPHFILPRKS